jgi:hypothetical protein
MEWRNSFDLLRDHIKLSVVVVAGSRDARVLSRRIAAARKVETTSAIRLAGKANHDGYVGGGRPPQQLRLLIT